jgi:hypothetical protein
MLPIAARLTQPHQARSIPARDHSPQKTHRMGLGPLSERQGLFSRPGGEGRHFLQAEGASAANLPQSSQKSATSSSSHWPSHKSVHRPESTTPGLWVMPKLWPACSPGPGRPPPGAACSSCGCSSCGQRNRQDGLGVAAAADRSQHDQRIASRHATPPPSSIRVGAAYSVKDGAVVAALSYLRTPRGLSI